MRVSTVHVRALVEAFESYGLRGADLLMDAGLSAQSLEPDYAWVELDAFDALIRSALTLSGDPAFGLHWGERTSMLQFDLASLLMAAAPTLREGLAGLLPFQEILGDRPEFCFDEQRDRARFRFEPFALSLEVARARAELAVVGFWRLLETVHGGKGRAAYFAHARPSYGDEYERILGERARFEHSFSGIVFPVELLDQPLLLRNPSVHRALSQQATQVRSRVLSLPAVPEMPRAASAVGISERSLRRRLEDEGSTYSQLVEEAKLDLSRELLADHARPIKQVAGALGFADVRSFHRAFKRWTGLTPVAYRAQR